MSRLIGAFSLLSLVTVSSAGAIAFFRGRAEIEKLVFERLEVTATLKEEALNLWVDNQRNAVASLARVPEIRDLVEDLLTSEERETNYNTLHEYLDSVLATKPEFLELFILSDIGGRILISTERDREGQYRVKDRYFTEGRLETFVQNVYPSSATGKPAMTIATPLADSKGRRMGVLAAQLNLEKMDGIVFERTGLGESGESYLVDRFNLLVSADRFGREEYPKGVHSRGIEAALQEEDGRGLYRNYADIPAIGVYRWMEERELALLVEVQQWEAFAPARRLAWAIVISGSILALFLAAIVYILAKQIARPILAIADVAVKVSQGDLSLEAPVLTQDEVGKLAYSFNQMTARMQRKILQLQDERKKSEDLLLNILPQRVAEQLKAGRETIAESFSEATVLFADLVGFTSLASRIPPVELVSLLNKIFSAFDALAERYGLEKIKTIGDAYMVVGGIPVPQDNHIEAIADLALAMQREIRLIGLQSQRSFALRVGIHTGPVVGGVIGLKRFSYDLWGDTVNIASRMESQGVPGCIQVTEETYHRLHDKFLFAERGTIDVKGKGKMQVYLLLEKKLEKDPESLLVR
ncbi:MAG: HAMP domain-containing protein [Cyanobacteria bacterium SBLK]|nr:HAMP domain-containing protein [Cyanobacteria bacterium SBLK]